MVSGALVLPLITSVPPRAANIWPVLVRPGTLLRLPPRLTTSVPPAPTAAICPALIELAMPAERLRVSVPAPVCSITVGASSVTPLKFSTSPGPVMLISEFCNSMLLPAVLARSRVPLSAGGPGTRTVSPAAGVALAATKLVPLKTSQLAPWLASFRSIVP